MYTRLTKTDGLLFIFAMIGLFVFIFFYPRLFPEASLKIEIQRDEIVQIGTDLIEDLGYDLTSYQHSIRMEYDQDQLQYLNQMFRPSEANRLMADSVSIYFWSLLWQIEEPPSTQFGRSPQEGLPAEEGRPGTFQMFIDLNGKPVAFESQPSVNEQDLLEEIAGAEEIDYNEAERLFHKLSQLYEGKWNFETSQEITNRMGLIHQFRWRRETDIANESVALEINMQGGHVQSFQRVSIIPESFIRNPIDDQWGGITVIILFFILFIPCMYYFIQRLRADLIDLKMGLVPGIVVFVGFIISYLTERFVVSSQPIWQVILGSLIIAPFVGGGIWILSAVGESLTREMWPDKLLAIDSSRRTLFSPILGVGLLRGMMLACTGLGLIILLNNLGISVFHGYYYLGNLADNSTLSFWTCAWPSLYTISHSILGSLYIIITFCLFLMALLKKRFHHSIWIFLVVFLLWSFVSFPITQLYPFALRMGIRALVGLLFVIFFVRYDFITVATGAIGLPILYYGVAALNTGIEFYTLHGLILIGLMGIILLFAFLAYRSEVPSGKIVPYVPDYLQRIYEKERIQRELEIARRVQLRFLPRSNPKIKGMDVAAFCLPAKEVGGDYYDFIEMGPKSLGVAIGDVSGKGISAAFYMTLTKGLLRSQARNLQSPRDILINMNELFYENADRGVFISMIYGVFDLTAKTLTFARAGHNPMISRRSGKGLVEEMNPPGIALGLERGVIFPRTIEEKTIGLEKNDVIFFYTDGLNEARNSIHEEFGEKRLMSIVEARSGLSAEGLLDKMQKEIHLFTADASQHDDMTAVVVKIL